MVGYSVSDFKNTEGVKSETSSSLLSLSSFKKKAWSKENTALKQQCPFSIENAHPIAFSALVWCVGGLAEFQRNSARRYKDKPSLSGLLVCTLEGVYSFCVPTIKRNKKPPIFSGALFVLTFVSLAVFEHN